MRSLKTKFKRASVLINKYGWPIKIVIYLIIAFVLYLIINPVWAIIKSICTKIKTRIDQAKITGGREVVKNPDGSETVVNTTQMATELFDAFFSNDWLGSTEDETKAVKTLLECPSNLIARMAIHYSELKKNLSFMHSSYKNTTMQQDCRTFLDDSNYQKIKHKLI